MIHDKLKWLERWRKAWSYLVATSLKNKEIFFLVCWDFPDYEWSLCTLDRGFWHIEIFCINYDTPIDPVFEAVNAEVESPGRLQGIRSIKYEEKNRSRGALKRGDRCKKMNEKSTVYFRWAFITRFIMLKW